MADNKTTLQKQESQAIHEPERTRSGKAFVPATDIIETDEAIILLSDMPGVHEKAVDITLENNLLTIQGCVNQEQSKDRQLVYSEYEVGDYYRSFTLSDTVDRDGITAELKNGVLKLTLLKAEKAKARQIKVNVG